MYTVYMYVTYPMSPGSLTLNKLRQKRMIEDKIAQRRAAQMEKLASKQTKEKEVCARGR